MTELKIKKSGILVIQLPPTNPQHVTAAHGKQEKEYLYPSSEWTSITTESEYKKRYPYLPDRIIDNLLKPKAKISVTRWKDLLTTYGELDAEKIRLLIDLTFNDNGKCEYDLSRPMRRHNS